MHKIERSAITPYSDREMYELVADIASYDQFLPWCRGAEIISSYPESVVAKINIGYRGVRKSFTTSNQNLPHHKIEVNLVDGPFSHFHGLWCFNALDEQACRVSLSMEFDFAGNMLSRMMTPVFSHISETMIEAFTKRAREIYGERTTA